MMPMATLAAPLPVPGAIATPTPACRSSLVHETVSRDQVDLRELSEGKIVIGPATDARSGDVETRIDDCNFNGGIGRSMCKGELPGQSNIGERCIAAGAKTRVAECVGERRGHCRGHSCPLLRAQQHLLMGVADEVRVRPIACCARRERGDKRAQPRVRGKCERAAPPRLARQPLNAARIDTAEIDADHEFCRPPLLVRNCDPSLGRRWWDLVVVDDGPAVAIEKLLQLRRRPRPDAQDSFYQIARWTRVAAQRGDRLRRSRRTLDRGNSRSKRRIDAHGHLRW